MEGRKKMSRPIDADETKRAFVGNRYGSKAIEYVIDSQPTVKAIPIDKPFLKMEYGDYVVYNKKWLVNHLQTEWNILQGKEYQPAIPIEWIKNKKVDFQNKDYQFNYTRGMQDGYNDCIDYLLSEWEKENERMDNR